MQRIRIAHVINSLRPGGGERFLTDLVKALPREEFDLTVFCLYSRGEFADEVEVLGVPVRVLGVPRKMSLGGYRRVYEALKKERFDIVHCHLLESCWYGLPSAWAAKVPVRIAHLQNCHWRLSVKLRLFDRLMFTFASAAFGCSRAVLRFYESQMWYPPLSATWSTTL